MLPIQRLVVIYGRCNRLYMSFIRYLPSGKGSEVYLKPLFALYSPHSLIHLGMWLYNNLTFSQHLMFLNKSNDNENNTAI